VSTRDLDTPPPMSEPPPVAAEPPPEGDPAPPRWSTGHTVAAAVVAVAVLATGGVAWAARDSTGATTGPGPVGRGGFGQQPGQQPGQLPGPGQPGGSGQLAPGNGGVDT
jgi:hypothetical protein